MAASLILFAPAAGSEIGGGHVMRDLALAEALQRRGAACVFAVPPWGERLLHRFASSDVEVHPLACSGDVAAIAAVVQALRPAALVLDDYRLAAAQTRGLAREGQTVVAIDDLADRDHACDLLVDPGFGRSPADYAGRTSPGCKVLAGPHYALLRSAFTEAAARPLRPVAERIGRLFVSFGLADPGGIAARSVERLRAALPYAALDVALAGDAASLSPLRALAAADPAVTLHPDTRDVAALMAQADAAVGAGGASTWERCALGLPSLAVVVADNQRAMIGRLAAGGVVLGADASASDFERAFDAAVARLAEPFTRAGLREASRGLCDGLGAARVANAILTRIGGGGPAVGLR